MYFNYVKQLFNSSVSMRGVCYVISCITVWRHAFLLPIMPRSNNLYDLFEHENDYKEIIMAFICQNILTPVYLRKKIISSKTLLVRRNLLNYKHNNHNFLSFSKELSIAKHRIHDIPSCHFDRNSTLLLIHLSLIHNFSNSDYIFSSGNPLKFLYSLSSETWISPSSCTCSINCLSSSLEKLSPSTTFNNPLIPCAIIFHSALFH